jgi:anaerobic ribonucleoside-triphosphate reductase activating protein
LQTPDDSTEVDIYDYFSEYNLSRTDGVTVSGGEPFEQPAELHRLVDYFIRRGVSDILVYTGYTVEELRCMKNPDVDGVLEKISVLIDGPYVVERDNGKGNLMGSDNQRIHYLIPKYKSLYEQYLNDDRLPEEMILGNTFLAVGIPDRDYIEAFETK